MVEGFSCCQFIISTMFTVLQYCFQRSTSSLVGLGKAFNTHTKSIASILYLEALMIQKWLPSNINRSTTALLTVLPINLFSDFQIIELVPNFRTFPNLYFQFRFVTILAKSQLLLCERFHCLASNQVAVAYYKRRNCRNQLSYGNGNGDRR